MTIATNRERLLDAIALQIDETLAACVGVKYSHSLLTSRGAALDKIGKFFAMSRDVGETDANFRILLSQLITIYASAGTKPAITAFLSALLDVDQELIKIYELAPGGISIYLPTEFEAREDDIIALLHDIVAAGVVVTLIWSETFWDSPDTLFDDGDKWM
ncbi:hypothetical protein [Bacteroides sp.]|uniref:hypothetical protein n=1 Tax=Bacteroides sp. TaxID=29523 RepID=UPI00260595A5|nr:hypothetical protein [Bacteroides sp.]MDD3039586.1 hypothetical protein [Bacteroides sp.]